MLVFLRGVLSSRIGAGVVHHNHSGIALVDFLRGGAGQQGIAFAQAGDHQAAIGQLRA